MRISEIRAYINEQQARLNALKREFGAEAHGTVTVPVQVTKFIICFVGLPGSGKSTQIERLQSRTRTPWFHLVKIDDVLHLEIDGRATSISQLAGKPGWSREELDQVVFAQVKAQESKHVILDGFPRSIEQADRLFKAAEDYGWCVQVIHLETNIRHAWGHQIRRSRQRGEMPDLSEYNGKIERSLKKDIPAVIALEKLGVKAAHISGIAGKDEVERNILSFLGL